jgi:uncharacterized protein YjiS (DUF1127 family)
MTDHVITRQAASHVSLAGRLQQVLRHWRARRSVRELQELDDRTLADIGVRRDEVLWASQLPLSVNAALELEAASFRRRRHNRFEI